MNNHFMFSTFALTQRSALPVLMCFSMRVQTLCHSRQRTR